jgi:hypothetical protein
MIIRVIILSLAMLSMTQIASAKLDPNDCDNFVSKNFSDKCNGYAQDQNRSAVGVGIDVLLYEDENVDVSEEYKYDWNNGSHSVYTVVKTKKSLVEYIKDLFNKEE